MKKLLHTLLIILFLSFPAFAGKIPMEVKKAFEQNFPGATHVKWDKESATEYEADFKWNNLNYSANFNDHGELLETEMEFAFNQLPDMVQAAFKITNPEARPKEVAKITTSSGVIKYEIEFKMGIKNKELFYTEEGVETK